MLLITTEQSDNPLSPTSGWQRERDGFSMRHTQIEAAREKGLCRDLCVWRGGR